MNQPNILLIMADQFRADALGTVGGQSKTPNLDGLASNGVLFYEAVTNSPECIPARYCLATGLYPHQTGVDRNAPKTLSPNAWTWMKALKEVGYRTSLIGKTHFHESAHVSNDLRDGLHLMHAYGFGHVDEIGGPRASMWLRSNLTDLWEKRGLWEAYRADFEERYRTNPFTARPSVLPLDLHYDTYVGTQAAEHLATLEGTKPWFCMVSFGGPHEPWDAPAPYDKMYNPKEMLVPKPKVGGLGIAGSLLSGLYGTDQAPSLEPAEVAALRANYAGKVTLIDDQIGTVLAALDSSGSRGNTIVIFTSDHGEMNGDYGLYYKQNFLRPAVSVPLIVNAPGASPTECRSNALVELVDVGATVLDYACIPSPAFANGLSLRPVIEGKRTAHGKFCVSEFSGHTMVMDASWKVELNTQGETVLLLDRVSDPGETENLAPHHGGLSSLVRAVGLRKALAAKKELNSLLAAWKNFRSRTSLSMEVTQ